MNPEFASADESTAESMRLWRPPPRLSLSEWADRYYYLSAESSAEPGRWHTIPYQRGIMDAFTDPSVTMVSVMKSARVGWTKILNAVGGYYMHQAPAPILIVQPTVDDAKGYSKEEIAPMIRDCPELSRLMFEDAEERVGPKDSGNTILHKKFHGGVLSIIGANSGTGFRRISRKVVLFDEVDAYPPSAGSDGDQVKLGIKRTEFYWDRKVGIGSTPLVAGQSRIATLFEQGDQRRYHVPCPQCGHMDYLVFTRREDGRGHYMQWPDGKPEEAHFVCSKNGCVIEHKDKRAMVEAGEWRADAPFAGHASFHIWAAYSYSPNATWADIAKEFLEAKKSSETLRTFVNTTLGETWQEQGEAPEWERLYNRRESYRIGTVPEGVRFLTAGVDVQKDRWVYEVVGWNENLESWSLEAGVIPGDTSNAADWAALDELLGRTWAAEDGAAMVIRMLAIDSGFNTQTVYNWGRRHPANRVITIKGVAAQHALVGAPSKVDVRASGKRIARGHKVWPVGSSVAKSELYGWLRLASPEGDQPIPRGWCHFPEHPEAYFKQLTAEQLATITNKRTRRTKFEWQILPGRENHWLDCRVYARAAAAVLGVDRLAPAAPRKTAPRPAQEKPEPKIQPPPAQPKPPAPPPPRKPRPRKASDSRFLSPRGTGRGWLKR